MRNLIAFLFICGILFVIVVAANQVNLDSLGPNLSADFQQQQAGAAPKQCSTPAIKRTGEERTVARDLAQRIGGDPKYWFAHGSGWAYNSNDTTRVTFTVPYNAKVNTYGGWRYPGQTVTDDEFSIWFD